MRSDATRGRPDAFQLGASATRHQISGGHKVWDVAASGYRSLENQMKRNWTCYMLAWLLAVANVAWAGAQTGPYPDKPLQIIADSSAGSTPDVALRIVADGLTQLWKEQVLVSNHPGAGGSLAVRLAAAAAPDGYTLYQ